MKKLIVPVFCLLLMFSLSGCGLMEDAFKAGVFFTLLIIAIIGLVIWLSRMVIRHFDKNYEWETIDN